MLKRELDKDKWLEGILKVDRKNLKVYLKDLKNNKQIQLTDGTKVMSKGMTEAEYRNITIGCFFNKDKTVEVDKIDGSRIYMKTSIDPYLKEFLQDHIDVDSINFLVEELKRYEVTLYDCTSFMTSTEENDEGYITGVNSILFNSEETYGYCYLIHRFTIDQKIKESVLNEFEFISIDGEKSIHRKEFKPSYRENCEITEEQKIENHFLDYYKKKYK